MSKLYWRAGSRAVLLGCASAMAVAALASPAFADPLAGQQVIDFFVNGSPSNDITDPAYGTPAVSGSTGCCNTYYGPAYSNSPGFQSHPGWYFDTTSSGLGGFSEASGNGVGVTNGHVANDAYDGYGGSGLVGVASFGGLTVTRQTEVTHGPSDAPTPITTSFTNAGVPNAGRWIETITNNTGSTITGTYAYFNNLGSDNNTHWDACPASGSCAITVPGNRYLISNQGSASGASQTGLCCDPVDTQILGNNAYTATQVTPVFVNGDDAPEWDYPISVAPGQTVRIVMFSVLTAGLNYDPANPGPEVALGQTLGDLITNNGNPILPSSPFFVGLDQAQLDTILNFDFGSGAIDLSQPFFIETDSPLLTDPATFDGGTLKPTTTYAFNQHFTVNSTGGTIDNTNGELTFAQAISGAGGLTFTGPNATVLLGANSYQGPTNVAAGTLRAGAVGGFSSNSAFTIASGATLDLNGFNQTIQSLAGAGALSLGAGSLTAGGDNSSTTFSGGITGSGGLTKAGTGTFTLSGAATYSGATNVNAGTLASGGANLLAANSAYVVASGATLDMGASAQTIGSLSGAGTVLNGGGILTAGGDGTSTTFSGGMSGTGGLVKTGGGTLILSGANAYTGQTVVGAGTLKQGASGALAPGSYGVATGATLDLGGYNTSIGSLGGNGVVALGAGTLTTGADNSSTTFSGDIAGTGGLTKVGTGVFTLSGDSSYSGATAVDAGELDLNGTIVNSTVTVGAGGTLKGHGRSGGLAFASGSIVAPGNSIGTLFVNGNVNFAAGSTYQVEANAAGQSDRIVASGTATIAGGTVQVLAATGNYPFQARYDIVSAAGGVTGNFTGLTSNLAFLDADLEYTAKDVTLVLTRNDIDFATVAATPNQLAVAGRIGPGGSHSALYKAMVMQTAGTARTGFDALSGEIHASLRDSLFEDGRVLRQSVLGRMLQSDYSDTSGPLAVLGDGGPTNAKGAAGKFVVWGSGFGDWDHISGDGNAAAVVRSSTGFTMGADTELADMLRLGVAGGYTHTNADIKARRSQSFSNTGHVAGYASLESGGFAFRAGGLLSWGDSRVTRQVVFPHFSNNTFAMENVSSEQVFGEVGYGMNAGGMAVEPFGNVAWIKATTGAFTETGGPAALSGVKTSDSLTYSSVGLRMATSFSTASGAVITPKLSVAWQHAFGGLRPSQRETILSTSQSFTVLGAPLDRDQALVQAGVGGQLDASTRFSLTYEGALSHDVRDNGLRMSISHAF